MRAVRASLVSLMATHSQHAHACDGRHMTIGDSWECFARQLASGGLDIEPAVLSALQVAYYTGAGATLQVFLHYPNETDDGVSRLEIIDAEITRYLLGRHPFLGARP
jgi:hypothetical protein